VVSIEVEEMLLGVSGEKRATLTLRRNRIAQGVTR
jgi:hypothetical protein